MSTPSSPAVRFDDVCLLRGDVREGDTVRVDAGDDGLVLSVVERHADGSVSEGSLPTIDTQHATEEK